MKLPWYMRSNNKATTITFIRIYVMWLYIRIIWNRVFHNKKPVRSKFWRKYKVWKG
jgi:hypothetical protein